MPTFGTHTPDLPYQPSSEMAWGPRGAEHMNLARTANTRRGCVAASVDAAWRPAPRWRLTRGCTWRSTPSWRCTHSRTASAGSSVAPSRSRARCTAPSSAWTNFAGRRENACQPRARRSLTSRLRARAQVKATPTSYHWTKSDIHLDGNYEVRLRDEDSTFTPNVGNLAPRPEG